VESKLSVRCFKELEALRGIAADLLKLSLSELDAQVESEALQEICHDCQD